MAACTYCVVGERSVWKFFRIVGACTRLGLVLDRLLDLFAHRFYVLVQFFPVFSCSYLRQVGRPLVNFWAHYETVTDWLSLCPTGSCRASLLSSAL